MKLILGFQNVRNTPDIPREQVEQCGRIMGQEDAHLMGFAEIMEGGEDAEDLTDGLGGEYRLVCRRTSTPIGFEKDRLKLLFANRLLLNEGDKDVPIPRRYVSEACVRKRFNPLAPKIVAICVHQVAGAWNGKDPSRQGLWKSQDSIIRARVNHYVMLGYTVVVFGDMNRVDVRPYYHNQVDVWGISGIDKIIVIPTEGYKCNVLRKWRRDTPSDHDALFAKVDIFKVKR